MEQISFPVLIGDIGGTNARFALLPDRAEETIFFDHVKVRDFDSIEEAILQVVSIREVPAPRSAILAAAGPVSSTGLDITNSHWKIDADHLLSGCGIDHLILFNDFDAQALALPYLQDDALVDITSPTGKPLPRNKQTKAVIGPGTGLGVGALVFANDRWIPVGGEGGHVDAAPRSSREEAIWHHLDTFEGRISGESVLSGSGLENIHHAICKLDRVKSKRLSASAVSSEALSGENQQSVEALEIFCSLLGRLAGDLALTIMAKGGVYIAGGIAPRILPFLKKSEFRRAFEDKAPHNDVMRSIATLVVVDPVPALAGLTAFARFPGQHIVSLEHRSWCR